MFDLVKNRAKILQAIAFLILFLSGSLINLPETTGAVLLTIGMSLLIFSYLILHHKAIKTLNKEVKDLKQKVKS